MTGFLPVCGKRKRRHWLGDLPIFKNHAPQQREQRLFEVKPFCPCFDFVSHRNGGLTNLHQVLCKKNGFKGTEIFWMLQTAYGDAVMSRRPVFEWYKRFKEGREETADNERSGRLSTSTTPEKVDKVLELNARKETASLNLEATTDDPELLKRVITGDETWIYDFDSETLSLSTQLASEWRFKNEPRPKKARKAPSKVKVMLTVFFDYQGIVHHEFQQQGSTITADSYLGVLRRLREAIRQKRPEL
ncbi:CLCN3 [Cordylochernes scorpioides]|uniref:CLCN3 n=1 Tax=Cordylochernes scorpioides TaxID=51811 RepID=A0ABY6KE19_9ARAC|nr:CLCN3 [Cordylochernes scorpioides]